VLEYFLDQTATVGGSSEHLAFGLHEPRYPRCNKFVILGDDDSGFIPYHPVDATVMANFNP
jgi:hypothetical protein